MSRRVGTGTMENFLLLPPTKRGKSAAIPGTCYLCMGLFSHFLF